MPHADPLDVNSARCVQEGRVHAPWLDAPTAPLAMDRRTDRGRSRSPSRPSAAGPGSPHPSPVPVLTPPQGLLDIRNSWPSSRTITSMPTPFADGSSSRISTSPCPRSHSAPHLRVSSETAVAIRLWSTSPTCPWRPRVCWRAATMPPLRPHAPPTDVGFPSQMERASGAKRARMASPFRRRAPFGYRVG